MEIEESILRIPLFATDFGRYHFSPNSGEGVIFPYRFEGGKHRQMTETELADRFPKAYSYLKTRKRELLRRKQYKSWFGFSAPRNLDVPCLRKPDGAAVGQCRLLLHPAVRK